MNITNDSIVNQNHDILMIRTNGRGIEVAASGKVAQFPSVAYSVFLIAYTIKAIKSCF